MINEGGNDAGHSRKNISEQNAIPTQSTRSLEHPPGEAHFPNPIAFLPFPKSSLQKAGVRAVFIHVVLSILGPILVIVGLRWFVNAIRRHPYLLRIKGSVVSVEEKYDRMNDQVTFFPTVAYTAPEGNQVRFRSSTGITIDGRR